MYAKHDYNYNCNFLQFHVYIRLIRHLPVGKHANIYNNSVGITEVHSSIKNVLINLVLSTPEPDYDD